MSVTEQIYAAALLQFFFVVTPFFHSLMLRIISWALAMHLCFYEDFNVHTLPGHCLGYISWILSKEKNSFHYANASIITFKFQEKS